MSVKSVKKSISNPLSYATRSPRIGANILAKSPFAGIAYFAVGIGINCTGKSTLLLVYSVTPIEGVVGIDISENPFYFRVGLNMKVVPLISV